MVEGGENKFGQVTVDELPTDVELRPRGKDLFVAPCANFCPVFERGNCVIDPRTQEMLLGVQEDENVTPKKEIIVFLGMPGAGKSTQVREIKKSTGAPVYHLGKYAKDRQSTHEGLRQQIESTRARGGLIEGLDELFLAEIANDDSSQIILDGFPRSIDQLVLLQDMALSNSWALEFVYVSFPETDGVELSMSRQVSRHQKESGNDPDDSTLAKFKGKIDRALAQDMAVAEALIHNGITNVITLDGTQPPEIVTKTLKKELGLDYDSLPFDRETLEQIELASKELGIEAWATGGEVYRAFWNNKFGPMQASTDIDISVQTEEDADRLQAYLEEKYPTKRWAVLSWGVYSGRSLGYAGRNFVEDMERNIVTARQAAVRISDGQIDLRLGNLSEADLRKGILRLDESAINELPEPMRHAQEEKAIAIARRQLREYPGLKLVGKMKYLYAEKYGDVPEPIDIRTKWGEIEENVMDSEFGGREKWSHVFTDQEVILAQKVVDFFVKADKKPSCPPKPAKSRLPGLLEDHRLRILNAKRNGDRSTVEILQHETLPVPDGYDNWLQFVCENADDNEFREWLLNQTRSRTPIGGADPTLRSVFDYSQFESYTANSPLEGEQKVTHQGWELFMHLKEATFQLATDKAVETLEGQSDQRKIRAAMRYALLYHDVGKLLNVNTPGSHEGIGAKLFLKCRPAWITDEVAGLTSELIRLHDVFGRLSRGICEKEGQKMTSAEFDVTARPSYKGALDPQIVRDEIAKINQRDFALAVRMVKSVWQADVGSVAALRWLLPIADHIEELILVNPPENHS